MNYATLKYPTVFNCNYLTQMTLTYLQAEEKLNAKLVL